MVTMLHQQKHYPTSQSHKTHFALVLIALLRNHGKICDFDRAAHLLDLLNLLKDEKLAGVTKEIFAQFVYYLSSMAHGRAVKDSKLSDDSIAAISRGYLISLSSEIDEPSSPELSAPLSKWLRSQTQLTRSIAAHFSAPDRSSVDNNGKCYQQLSKLIWNPIDESASQSTEFADKFALRPPVVTAFDAISRDVSCLSHYFADLKLISWQMAAYDSNISVTHDVGTPVFDFIGEFVGKLFSKLPIGPSGKRSPENISRTDITVFLIGTHLTYRKSFLSASKTVSHGNRHANSVAMPYPYELWHDIRIPEVLHKWWQAACDFTLQNKRNTSIGALRDLLKSGIDSLQLVDNQMSDVLKLHLGKLTLDCAIGGRTVVAERESLRARAVAFFDSVLRAGQQHSTTFKNAPISTQAMRNTVASRQRSFTSLAGGNGGAGGFKTRELFDTATVSDDVLDEWRLEGCLLLIDWSLQQPVDNDADFEQLLQLARTAETLRPSWPGVHLAKARVYWRRAQLRRLAQWPQVECGELARRAVDSAHTGVECGQALAGGDKQAGVLEMLQQLLEEMQTGESLDCECLCVRWCAWGSD